MFRTVIINTGEKLSIKDNWLVVDIGGEEKSIPIEDIYSVVIDNRNTVITVAAVTALTEAGVHVLFCNEKHMPVSVLYPLNAHYRPLNVVRKQLELRQSFKDELLINM